MRYLLLIVQTVCLFPYCNNLYVREGLKNLMKHLFYNISLLQYKIVLRIPIFTPHSRGSSLVYLKFSISNTNVKYLCYTMYTESNHDDH